MKLHLMPRQEQFFELFDRAAANAVKAAQVLNEMVKDFNKAPEMSARAVEAEHEGDFILHDIFKRLNDSFITPLDREDIHALADGLDDITDFIESACDRLVLYAVTEPTSEAIEMADVILQATQEVQKAVSHLSELRDTRKVLDPCVRVNDFENEGDRINRKALKQIFSGAMEPLEAMKWREIYDHFEEAIDKCEHVAHILEGIVVKNA
ncbi:MAG: DUF47 domain-containing protein [Armatimonadetes bacterium]|nr:DUF47 domain-containing protein [Armatimonadota bacterium]